MSLSPHPSNLEPREAGSRGLSPSELMVKCVHRPGPQSPVSGGRRGFVPDTLAREWCRGHMWQQARQGAGGSLVLVWFWEGFIYPQVQ